VSLYRASAGHLSRIRTGAPDPELIVEVSARVAAARGRITGTRETRMSDLIRFWLRSAPAALYRVRWWTVGVMIAEIAIAVIIAVWTLRSPEAMSAVGTPQERDDYARSMFESYYTRYEPSDFAVQVWTNNARIAAVCVASGITGILPAYMLFINAFSVGKAAAIMADHDALGLFFALITPHGLLELTCIFIAGGAGLRLFWTLLAPGPRSRGAALAAERRTDADLKRIDFWRQKFETACESGNLEHQAEADVSFHQTIADAAHNILFSHLSSSLLKMLYQQTRSGIIYIYQTPRC